MLEDRLKTALDESRLLILGAQVLFGFQFQSVFQERFGDLDAAAKAALTGSLVLLLLSMGLLIAPSLHHQIRFRGESRAGALKAATFFAGASLLPLTIGLGLSAYAVSALNFGAAAGAATGITFSLISLLLLYGWGLMIRPASRETPMPEEEETPLKTKIEQLLTEARVIIPGGQALLGFQFIAMLTQPFSELPQAAQIAHAAGLCAVALAVTLLMTPAALHRLAFAGENSPRFFRMAHPLVMTASAPLAGGIAADFGVVFWKVSESGKVSAVAGLCAFAVLIGLWVVWPLMRRAST